MSNLALTRHLWRIVIYQRIRFYDNIQLDLIKFTIELPDRKKKNSIDIVCFSLHCVSRENTIFSIMIILYVPWNVSLFIPEYSSRRYEWEKKKTTINNWTLAVCNAHVHIRFKQFKCIRLPNILCYTVAYSSTNSIELKEKRLQYIRHCFTHFTVTMNSFEE